jgi:hypothetical protein
MSKEVKLLRPLILLFIFFNAFFLLNRNWLSKRSLDNTVLLSANLLFFTINLLIFFLQKRGVKNPNPNVFVRAVLGGTMIKMAVCIIAVMLYVLLWRDSFSKMSVFAAMFLYLIYLAVEVAAASKMNKQKDA